MGLNSMLPKAMDEDIRFTEYRLSVARELPDSALRQAVVEGIVSRLQALSRKRSELASAGRAGYSGARV